MGWTVRGQYYYTRNFFDGQSLLIWSCQSRHGFTFCRSELQTFLFGQLSQEIINILWRFIFHNLLVTIVPLCLCYWSKTTNKNNNSNVHIKHFHLFGIASAAFFIFCFYYFGFSSGWTMVVCIFFMGYGRFLFFISIAAIFFYFFVYFCFIRRRNKKKVLPLKIGQQQNVLVSKW